MNQIEKLMAALGCTEEEAREIMADDEEIDKGKKMFELPKEQEDASRKARSTTGKKKPNYKPEKKERKADEVKRDLIAGFSEYIKTIEGANDFNVDNPERIVSFQYGEDRYEIILQRKRAKKD